MTRRVVRSLLVVVFGLAVCVAGVASAAVVDLTSTNALTLTDQSRHVLAGLDRKVRITAFVRRDEAGRVEAAALLARYRAESQHVTATLVDPADRPGDAARLRVDPLLGGVAVVMGTKVEVVPSVTEQDLTAAIARLQRAEVPTVCFTAGHGEAEYREARQLLEREGYDVATLSLLGTTSVRGCDAVVVAGPTAPFTADALAALTDYAVDGKTLVLADPAATPDASVAALLQPVGLSVIRGLVFEADPQAVIAGDATAPVVRTYSSAHPIVRRIAPTYFPGVQGLTLDDAAEQRIPGLTLSRLADTSRASYLETEPVAARFDDNVDVAGPVTVAVAADRSRNDGERIARTRLVVVADADFIGDEFLRQAGNATLLVRSVDWLVEGADVAAISPNLAPDRPLALTDARVAYARLVTAGLVPALFLLAGAMVWAARRGA